jgi:hypothetical protein
VLGGNVKAIFDKKQKLVIIVNVPGFAGARGSRRGEEAFNKSEKRSFFDNFVKIQKILTILSVPKIISENLCKGHKKRQSLRSDL